MFFVVCNVIFLELDKQPPFVDGSGHVLTSFHLKQAFVEKGPVGFVKAVFDLEIYPPLFYISAAPLFLFTHNIDFLTYINFFYLAILIFSSYLYMRKMHSSKMGFFFAIGVMCIPIVYGQSRVFWLDFAAFSFLPLAMYLYESSEHFTKRKHGILFAVVMSLAFLIKWFSWYFLMFYFVIRFFGMTSKEKRLKRAKKLEMYLLRMRRYIVFFLISFIIPFVWLFFKGYDFFVAASGDVDLGISWWWFLFTLYESIGPLRVFFLISLGLLIYLVIKRKEKLKNIYIAYLFATITPMLISAFVLRSVPRWYMGSFMFMLLFILLVYSAFERSRKWKIPTFNIVILLFLLVMFVVQSFFFFVPYAYRDVVSTGRIIYDEREWGFDKIADRVALEHDLGKIDIFLTDSFMAQNNYRMYIELKGFNTTETIYPTMVINGFYVFNETDMRNRWYDAELIVNVSRGDNLDILSHYEEYSTLLEELFAESADNLEEIYVQRVPGDVETVVYLTHFS